MNSNWPMEKPIKWQAEREAFARGEKIEAKATGKWYLVDEPVWKDGQQYRIHDPYREYKEAKAAGKVIQQVGHGSGDWFDCGDEIGWTRPPECYRIKPAPVMVPPCYADVPPLSILRHSAWDKNQWSLVLQVHENGPEIAQGIEEFDALQSEGWLIKRPGEDWQKCEKEAKS